MDGLQDTYEVPLLSRFNGWRFKVATITTTIATTFIQTNLSLLCTQSLPPNSMNLVISTQTLSSSRYVLCTLFCVLFKTKLHIDITSEFDTLLSPLPILMLTHNIVPFRRLLEMHPLMRRNS